MHRSRTDSARSIRLADGRHLIFVSSGPENGHPVLYCHGAIGTPLSRSVDVEAIADRLGIRHVALSRPGIGGSDASAARRVVDLAADVRQLADALGLARFDVVGVSAGGPYALGIAHELDDRVGRAAICSSVSPPSAAVQHSTASRRVRLALSVLQRAPATCAAVGDAAVPLIRRHPELLMRVIAAHASPAERAKLALLEERRSATTSFLDAAAHGVRGMIDDYLACSRDWGFRAAGVKCEVDLWHGMEDPLVPIDHALALALELPRCRLFIDSSEGHHFFRRRLAEILAALVGREGAGPRQDWMRAYLG